MLGSLVSISYDQQLAGELHTIGTTAQLPTAVLTRARSFIAAVDAVAAHLHTHTPNAGRRTDHQRPRRIHHRHDPRLTIAALGAIASAIALPAHNRRRTATSADGATIAADPTPAATTKSGAGTAALRTAVAATPAA